MTHIPVFRRLHGIGAALVLAAVTNAQCPLPNSVTFQHTGAMQSWTVPPGVLEVTVVVDGARGGSGGLYPGGAGARVSALLPVNPGATLRIAVGGRGQTYGGSGGGGGASYLAFGTANSAFQNSVLVAGGGGGASAILPNAGAGGGPAVGSGYGGIASASNGGAGGAGVQTDGFPGGSGGVPTALGGKAPKNGAAGGTTLGLSTGGFGGGGAANLNYGGGGGGYSGGRGSTVVYPALGGSSYWSGSTSQVSHVAGGNPQADGRVTITWRDSVTFTHTGALQIYTVPAGVDRLRMRLGGGAGGSAPASVGARGGMIEGYVDVHPGEQLVMLVAKRGVGAGGGGGTFVARGTTASAFAAPLLVAGGGGGPYGTATFGGYAVADGGPGGHLGASAAGGASSYGGGGGGALTSGVSNQGLGGQAATLGGAGATHPTEPSNRGGYGGGGSGEGDPIGNSAYTSGGGGGGLGGGHGGRGILHAVPGIEPQGGTSYHAPSVPLLRQQVGGNAADNGFVTIQPASTLGAAATTRTGGNPNALSTTQLPQLGTTWTCRISHQTFVPNALLDGLVLSYGPLSAPTPYGTLLCDVFGAYTVEIALPGADFALAIPNNCQFFGYELCTQGLSIDPTGTVSLANAIDLVIGPQ